MFVRRRARLVTGAGRGGSGSGGDRRAVDALQPGAAVARARRGSGRSAAERQTRRRPSAPASATTPSQNALPSSYWRSFSSSPSSRASRSPSPPRRSRRASRRRRSSVELEAERRRARVHDVLGVPLDRPTSSPAAGRASRRRCGSASTRASSPRSAARTSARGSRGEPPAEPRERRRVEALGGALDQLRGELAQVRCEPRDPLELDHVRALVQRDPVQEGVAIGLEAAPGRLHVLAHEQQARRAGRVRTARCRTGRARAWPRSPRRAPPPLRSPRRPRDGRSRRAGPEGRGPPRPAPRPAAAASLRPASALRAHSRRSTSSGTGGHSTPPRPA